MSAVTRWWWVRHAPVPYAAHGGRIYGAADVPCDCSDSAAFARLAALLPAGAVWMTTPLSRTGRTADAVRAAGLVPGGDIHCEAGFAEQDFGAWQMRTSWDALRAVGDPVMEDFWKAPAVTRTPDGESFTDVLIRTAPAIERLTGRHRGRDIVAFAHGGTIRAALAHALTLAPPRAMGFRIDNLSVTRIDHVPGGDLAGQGDAWQVVMVNRVTAGQRGA